MSISLLDRNLDEGARLAVLHEYRLLDAPADYELEAVVRVAAAVAEVPTAALNIIDENRQCQPATVGFDGADRPRSESKRRKRFMATVLDTVDVGIAMADPSGHVSVLNRAAREMHGVSAEPAWAGMGCSSVSGSGKARRSRCDRCCPPCLRCCPPRLRLAVAVLAPK
ncbi:hypothetical protein ACFQS1_33190 [Paractinoplanes rhizophilus]|uniref:PAS domain-containing protein n=1 Tax=Paractinoplanes rhizophilus TaxID=1416877 RepID=A0ABW2I1W0_9ACTN